MRVFQIFSKIILTVAIVGVALTSIAVILMASNVLNMDNQFRHLLSAPVEISKGQLIGTLTAAAISGSSGMQPGIITFMAEVVENRDDNTGGHIRRTAKYVECIALQRN